jgi:chorismate mutase
MRGVTLSKLNDLRQNIQEIDKKLVSLLCERMKLSIRIGQIKKEKNLSIKDPVQEQQVIKNIITTKHDPLKSEDLKNIFDRIIQISRESQQESFNEIDKKE